MKRFSSMIVASLVASMLIVAYVISAGGMGTPTYQPSSDTGIMAVDPDTMKMDTWKKMLSDPVIAFKPGENNTLVTGKLYKIQSDLSGNWGYHESQTGIVSVDPSDSWILIKTSALTDREFVIRDRELMSVKDIDKRGWWSRNLGWTLFWRD